MNPFPTTPGPGDPERYGLPPEMRDCLLPGDTAFLRLPDGTLIVPPSCRRPSPPAAPGAAEPPPCER
jgi:hypothetical protein